MPLKTARVTPEKDADLLKAVIQTSGGVKGGIAFWNEVAGAMSENMNGEAARKRFDKFKPGAAVKASVNSEKDADLLKAVIKANGGISNSELKGKAFWAAVADAMEETINGEAARKRFDKFKPKTDDGEDGGAKKKATPKSKGAGKGKKGGEVARKEGGENDVQNEPGAKNKPKKKAAAKPKATKGAGMGKKAVKAEEAAGSEEEGQDHGITEVNGGSDMGREEGAGDGYAVPDTKVYKATFHALIAAGKANPPQKRAYVESWAEEVSSSSELDVETPAKKMKLDDPEDQDEA